MTVFNVNHSKLQGFSSYYDREILPGLEEDEIRRKSAFRHVWRVSPLIFLLGSAFNYFLWTRFETLPLAFFGFMVSIMFAVAYGAHALGPVRKDTKNRIVTGVCDYLGWAFSAKVQDPPHLDILIENGLLPSRYTRVSFEDKIYGEAHGADFETVECHMEQRVKSKDNESYQTVFRGAVMALDFHRKFLGRTVVLRDKGLFNPKAMKGMKRVGLVDPKFEKIFEAYSTDQVESRYLLTPDFMQRLVDLEESVDGKKIRFAFLENLLLVVVETPNRFESGSMFKPLIDTARTQKVLDEIAAVYNLVDGITKPQKL